MTLLEQCQEIAAAIRAAVPGADVRINAGSDPEAFDIVARRPDGRQLAVSLWHRAYAGKDGWPHEHPTGYGSCSTAAGAIRQIVRFLSFP